jgi:hypothetical protein
MRNAALLVRAAMEEHCDAMAGAVAQSLGDVAFTGQAVEMATAELRGGLLPITKEVAANLVAESIAGLDDNEAAMLGVGPLWRAEAPYDVASAQEPERPRRSAEPARSTLAEVAVRLAAQAVGAEPEWSDPSGLAFEPFTDIPQWWATAALELRGELSPGLTSVYCVTPVHRRGDQVLLEEITYTGREIKGLENPKVTGGAVTEQYGHDVDQVRVPGFFETVDRELRSFCYVPRISDEHANRAARRIGKALRMRGDAIVAAFEASAEAAKPAALAAAATHGVPPELIEPLTGLLIGMATGLIEKVRQSLERAFADVILTPWLLTHTVALPAIGAARVKPLSVWLLESAGDSRWWLTSSERDQRDPSKVVRMRDDYQHHVRFNYRGRLQFGASRSPALPCPADLAVKVAAQGRPAVWVEPLTEPAGFRALLPHSAPRGGMYVTAIRSELRHTTAENGRHQSAAP